MQTPDDTPALDTSFHDHEVNVGPDAWERWITKVEELIGHTLDGDQTCDGYSYDWLIDLFDTGDASPGAALALIEESVKENERRKKLKPLTAGRAIREAYPWRLEPVEHRRLTRWIKDFIESAHGTHLQPIKQVDRSVSVTSSFSVRDIAVPPSWQEFARTVGYSFTLRLIWQENNELPELHLFTLELVSDQRGQAEQEPRRFLIV